MAGQPTAAVMVNICFYTILACCNIILAGADDILLIRHLDNFYLLEHLASFLLIGWQPVSVLPLQYLGRHPSGWRLWWHRSSAKLHITTQMQINLRKKIPLSTGHFCDLSKSSWYVCTLKISGLTCFFDASSELVTLYLTLLSISDKTFVFNCLFHVFQLVLQSFDTKIGTGKYCGFSAFFVF